MPVFKTARRSALAVATLISILGLAGPSAAQTSEPKLSDVLSAPEYAESVGRSPWGPEDELGRLNLMTDSSRAAVLSRIDGGKVYDLAAEYFVGMPGYVPAGDPRYTFWMTHTPRGTVIDNPTGQNAETNTRVSYTGTAFSMYAHTGTHIDALNHFGLDGEIYNGFKPEEHLGDRGWKKTGMETMPPIVARGVLIDVAKAKGVKTLPDGYRIMRADLEDALKKQGTKLEPGDVVLIRTGQYAEYDDTEAFTTDFPGLDLDGAKFLTGQGAMVLGSDNLSLEVSPSQTDGNYIPVHTYLLAQSGIPIIELLKLDELSENNVHEFAFIAAPLKIRGGDASPFRPVAMPLRPR